MAQVLSDSIIGYPESLAIFSKPVQNIGVKKYRCINYYPVNDFTTQGVVQFHVSGNGSSYIDLSKTLLNIRCRIVKRDGTSIKETSLANLAAVQSRNRPQATQESPQSDQ